MSDAHATMFDLYSALASVAAITTAIQASATLVPLAQAERLERRRERTAPATLDAEVLKDEAKTARRTALFLVFPAALVNAVVLAPWGDVVFGRLHFDWALVLPWAAVALVWAAMVASAVWGIVRIGRVGER